MLIDAYVLENIYHYWWVEYPVLAQEFMCTIRQKKCTKMLQYQPQL